MKTFQKVGGVGYLVQFFITAIFAVLFLLGVGFISLLGTSARASSAASSSTSAPSNITDALVLLLVIPLVPLLMISSGWLLAGREGKIGLFTWTGVLGMISSVLLFGGLAGTFSYLLSMLSSVAATGSQNLTASLGNLLIFTGIEGLGGLLSFVFFVLLIVSLFRAAKIYGVKMLRYAGISMLASIVLSILAVGLILISLISDIARSVNATDASSQAPQLSSGFFETLVLGIILLLIPGALTSLFAGLGFLKVNIPTPEAPLAPEVPPASAGLPPMSTPPPPAEPAKPRLRKYVALAAVIAVVLVVGTISASALIPATPITSVITTPQMSTTVDLNLTNATSSGSCPQSGLPSSVTLPPPLTVGAQGLSNTTFVPYATNGNGELYVASELILTRASHVSGEFNSSEGVEVMVFCTPSSGAQNYHPPPSYDLTGYVYSTGPGIDVNMNATLPAGTYEILVFDPADTASVITLTQGLSISS